MLNMDREEFIEQLKAQNKGTIEGCNLENKHLVMNVEKYLQLRKWTIISDKEKNAEEQRIISYVIEYFKNHSLNFNNIVYWDKAKFDEDGNLYLNGDIVNEELYSEIQDIFVLNKAIKKVIELELIPFENELLVEFFNGVESKDNFGRIY